MPHRRTTSFAQVLRVYAMTAACLIVVALAWPVSPGVAEIDTVDTTFSVATTTSIDPTGCASDVLGITDFGIVLPDIPRVTPTDCQIKFGGNVAVTLKAYQLDGTGAAFVGQAPTTTPWVPLISGTIEHLRAVTATPSGHLWASGYHGSLIASIDGGDTWAQQSPNPSTDTLRDLYAVDDNVVWGTGWNGNIVRTVDGGENWTQVGRKAPMKFTTNWQTVRGGVRAIDDQIAWAAATGGDVFHTVDGGTTWTTQNTGLAEEAWGMDLVAPDKLWVVGANGYIAHTSDGGTTPWELQSLPGSSGNVDLFRIDAWDAQTAYVTGGNGHVFRTADGGLSWQDVSVAATAERLDGLRVFSSSHVVVVGDNGVIFETVDAGASWQPRVSGTNQDLRALWGPDPVSMVAVGQSGIAVRSPVVEVEVGS